MKKLKYSQQGFTLLELMITVAIIGIIASIAVPSYTDYVKKGKAAEATSNLADLRIKMEQCFQDNRDYTACAAFCTPTSATPSFAYACGALTATTYTLTATGAGDMSNFSFNVDEANDKNSTYDGTTGTGCWLSSKSGSC